MSLEKRLDQLEQRFGGTATQCTHITSITNDSQPVPKSRCECGGWHPVIVVVRPKGERLAGDVVNHS
jgi:hypothetical protein